ncbi:MAG: hypothetical protein R6V31_12025 [Halohasta sp.]
MSVLSRYLAWFGDQQLSVQVGSTILVFGLLFVSGVYTLGIVPLVVVVAVMVDHWYRAER